MLFVVGDLYELIVWTIPDIKGCDLVTLCYSSYPIVRIDASFNYVDFGRSSISTSIRVFFAPAGT
jgi:hypothetical protein